MAALTPLPHPRGPSSAATLDSLHTFHGKSSGLLMRSYFLLKLSRSQRRESCSSISHLKVSVIFVDSSSFCHGNHNQDSSSHFYSRFLPGWTLFTLLYR